MSHEHAWTRLPDLLEDRDEPALLTHVAGCHDCQQQLFLLGRVDRMLRRAAAPARRQDRRRAPTARLIRVSAGLAAAAAVVLLALLLPLGLHHDGSRRFTLRAASGEPIGRAVLARADAGGMSLSLVARALPARDAGAYVLWGGADGDRPTTIGRFMVDRKGECRAKFKLPAGRSWARFWVTRPGTPDAVVATT